MSLCLRRQLVQGLLITSLSPLFARADATASEWVRSRMGLYRVTAAPASGRAPVGRFHPWIVSIVTNDGFVVSGARVSVSGGMPGHGHGMPSQPEVTREVAAGQYLVEGMRFNMQGQWELTISVDSPSGADVALMAIEVSL